MCLKLSFFFKKYCLILHIRIFFTELPPHFEWCLCLWEHVQSGISVFESKHIYSKNKENFRPTINVTPNSNHSKQPRFFSTKKKKETTKKHWAKPTMDEQEKAKSKMINTDIKVCGICWRDEDNTHDVYIPWIECDYCGL